MQLLLYTGSIPRGVWIKSTPGLTAYFSGCAASSLIVASKIALIESVIAPHILEYLSSIIKKIKKYQVGIKKAYHTFIG